jgi:hypothetical protein
VLYTGHSAAHAELVMDEGQLRQEVIGQAVSLYAERIWVEKVRLATQPLGAVASALHEEAQGALAELAALALSAQDDPEFIRSLQADWQMLLEKLPHDVLQGAPDLALLRQDPQSQVVERMAAAAALLMARVGQAERSAP